MLGRLDQQDGLRNTQAWDLKGRLHPVQARTNMLCEDMKLYVVVNQWEVEAPWRSTRSLVWER
ncbi:MAG: hypothetical protein CL912_13105 [Deltaproteobacteria bacterium]|nr:hypothetical protein [Deltaproteobacteria bacterium]